VRRSVKEEAAQYPEAKVAAANNRENVGKAVDQVFKACTRPDQVLAFYNTTLFLIASN
jgi:hypothetical protein